MLTPIENPPSGAVSFVASGRVTLDDFENVLEPTIQWAREDGRVRLLYVVGTDFEGYEDGGLYDHVVFGTGHFCDFERIAFVADEGPFRRAAQAMTGLMPADLRVFKLRDIHVARNWLGSLHPKSVAA